MGPFYVIEITGRLRGDTGRAVRLALGTSGLRATRGFVRSRMGRHDRRRGRVARHGHQDRHAAYCSTGAPNCRYPPCPVSSDRTATVCVPKCPLSELGPSDEREYPLIGYASLGHPSGVDDCPWFPGHGANPAGRVVECSARLQRAAVGSCGAGTARGGLTTAGPFCRSSEGRCNSGSTTWTTSSAVKKVSTRTRVRRHAHKPRSLLKLTDAGSTENFEWFN